MTTPPWTPEQVAKLAEWQACNHVHPFTCPDHADHLHRWARSNHGWRDALTPTAEGWRCGICGYTQDWAHDHMLEGAPPDPMEMLRCSGT